MLMSKTSLKWMRYASLQFLGVVVALAPSGTRADDYVLPAGETDTIALADGTATNITSLTVAGALTVTGDGWIKTPTLKLDGGTLTVDGLGETLNLKTWTVVIDGAPSKYKVVCSNGQLVLVPPGVCIIFR